MRKLDEKKVSIFKVVVISAGVLRLWFCIGCSKNISVFPLIAATVIPAVRTASETNSIRCPSATMILLPDAAFAMKATLRRALRLMRLRAQTKMTERTQSKRQRLAA